MASPQQKAFCVLEFAKTKSIVTVQRAFQGQFHINAPSPKNIRRWFQQFQERGCLCKKKSPGRPSVSEAHVTRIRSTFERSPRKSTYRASRELAIPQSTVWRVLRRRLHLKPYRLCLVQALTDDDKRKRIDFCSSMLEMIDDETFISRLVFSDEATFHLSGTVNRHNVRIWGTEHPHETVEHVRNSPKVNVFCAVSRNKIFGPFFFENDTVTGQSYLDMLQHWLFTLLQEDRPDFIFQQDGAPAHWHLNVRNFLNEKVPQRWIGRKGDNDLALCAWPPRSPDLTVCDFFLWGYVKDRVYVPPLPTSIHDLKQRIAAAIDLVDRDMLINVWEEFSYRIDVARASGGGHIEHL